MAEFIVRVQLSKESPDHYTILRDGLLDIGFTKRIKSKEGIEYRLPNGNYFISTNKSIDVVFDAVKRIALKIDKTPQVLVTETTAYYWFGLQKC